MVVAFPLLAEALAMLASMAAPFPARLELAEGEEVVSPKVPGLEEVVVVSPKVPGLEEVVLAILMEGVVLASAPMAYQGRAVEWGHRQGQL